MLFFVSSYLILLTIGRAKKVLDFTFSLYFFHLLIVFCYDSFPFSWEFWLVNICGLLFTIVLGEYLCMNKELEAIPMRTEDREERERLTERGQRNSRTIQV
jgi:hypothetical protein